mmetsp:Transcript_14723/g.42403  ORF Transcript_14723/g.42403 Transcript_14723/m.42403 type:complete len:246 (+) Transcript_14723:1087-1824(+)
MELCADRSLGPRRYPKFCAQVGEIPTFPPTQVPPTPAPTATPKCLDLEIKFDNFPEEIGWSIQPVAEDGSSREADGDGDDAGIITRVPGYYRNVEGQVVKEKICLGGIRPDSTKNKFSFIIVDKRGDGMLSGSQGSYALFDTDDRKVLAQGGGNFKLVKMETMEIGLTSDATNEGEEDGVTGEEDLDETASEDGSTIIPEEDKRNRGDGTSLNSEKSGAVGRSGERSLLALGIAVSAAALLSLLL